MRLLITTHLSPGATWATCELCRRIPETIGVLVQAPGSANERRSSVRRAISPVRRAGAAAVAYAGMAVQRIAGLDNAASPINEFRVPLPSRVAVLERLRKAAGNPSAVQTTADVNSEEAVEWVKAFGPDILITIGGRRLGEGILASARVCGLNLHGGVLPRYRGLGGGVWPVLMADEDNLGWTIHVLTPRLDSGPVVSVGRLVLDPHWDLEAVDDWILIRGTAAMADVLLTLQATGRLPALPVPEGEEHYYHPPSRWQGLRAACLHAIRQTRRRKGRSGGGRFRHRHEGNPEAPHPPGRADREPVILTDHSISQIARGRAEVD